MFRKILTTLPIFFLLISCAEAQDISQLIKAGQAKEEIKKIIGSPNEIEKIVKSVEHIWGPEEEFWSKIPMGTKLEVWRYKNKDGQLNLYFEENKNTLSYKAYAPAGVVYESNE
jgi:hypothetical protein